MSESLLTNTLRGYIINIPRGGILEVHDLEDIKDIKTDNAASACCAEEAPQNCCECCRHKHTQRGEQEMKQLRNRINRIIGQMNGIQKMLDENRYCGDVLTQIAAAESALQGLGYLVLQEHLKTCVCEEVANGNVGIMDEAVELIKKLK